MSYMWLNETYWMIFMKNNNNHKLGDFMAMLWGYVIPTFQNKDKTVFG